MRNILEELYMGNVGFDAGYYGQNSHFVKAAKRKLESMEKLSATLNDNEKELFEQFQSPSLCFISSKSCSTGKCSIEI